MKFDRQAEKLSFSLCLLLIFLSSCVLSQCQVDGCATCKTGTTDLCSKCHSDGYEEEFIRDSTGAVRLTCKKVKSTGVILGIVLGICGGILCITIILLFLWIHIKRLIKKNVAFFTSRRSELLQKQQTYEQQRRAHEQEIIAYNKQRTEYEERRRRMEEQQRLEQDLERQKAMLAMTPPSPPPMYNIFMEMEKDYINRRQELERAQSLRLPPGFLSQNPLPPPIQPLTQWDTFTPTPFGVSNDATGAVPQNTVSPTPYRPTNIYTSK